MSKELTPLQKLNNLYYILCHYSNKCGVGGAYTEEECGFNAFELKKDIETKLKRLETLEEDFMSLTETNMELVQEQARNQKKLKALEIIKEKRVDIHNLIYSSNVEEYNKFALNYNQELCNTLLTQEEYDLLKEVFK